LWESAAEAPELIRQTLADCDLVKLSDDEVAPLFGPASPEEAARRLRELGVTLAIISLGGRGCYFDAPTGAGFVPGERVSVVDTTGAGDAFVAALWSRLLPRLAEVELEQVDRPLIADACALANRAGALACTRLGAASAMPTRAELL
jgi:fructokinase